MKSHSTRRRPIRINPGQPELDPPQSRSDLKAKCIR
uniref:Uncharacterized protein n=1 Tax=Moniliophthora roreri TaxID=221103 RepID=A0A0W0FWI2_MONRR